LPKEGDKQSHERLLARTGFFQADIWTEMNCTALRIAARVNIQIEAKPLTVNASRCCAACFIKRVSYITVLVLREERRLNEKLGFAFAFLSSSVRDLGSTEKKSRGGRSKFPSISI
jgi:hypothetical protein